MSKLIVNRKFNTHYIVATIDQIFMPIIIEPNVDNSGLVILEGSAHGKLEHSYGSFLWTYERYSIYHSRTCSRTVGV